MAIETNFEKHTLNAALLKACTACTELSRSEPCRMCLHCAMYRANRVYPCKKTFTDTVCAENPLSVFIVALTVKKTSDSIDGLSIFDTSGREIKHYPAYNSMKLVVVKNKHIHESEALCELEYGKQ